MTPHDIGFDPQPGDQVDKDQLGCGHPIDGAAVGQPGQQVKCRSVEFELRLTPKGVASVCPTCRAVDQLPVYRTTNRSQHPQHPDLLTCLCGAFRFRLYEDGNTWETRCVACGYAQELGNARSLGV